MQPDQLLVNALKDYIKVPQHLTTIKDFRVEDVMEISLLILEHLGVDVQEVRKIQMHRFRSMTRLNQQLYTHLEAQFELNDLLNPSVPFVRKFVLAAINKLTSLESNDRSDPKGQTINTDETRNKKLFQNWLSEEWIHPCLTQPKARYQAYLMPISLSKPLLKRNLGWELSSSQLKGNACAVLVQISAEDKRRKKHQQEMEGYAQKQTDEINLNRNKIVKLNKEDWVSEQKKYAQIKSPKKEKKKPEAVSEEPIPTPQKVHQIKLRVEVQTEQTELVSPTQREEQQYQKQQEQQKQQQQHKQQHQEQQQQQQKKEGQQEQKIHKQAIKTLSPLEKVKKELESSKKSNEELIAGLILELQRKKQEIENLQGNKLHIQGEITINEEKLETISQDIQQTKKNVEKRKTLLQSIEGQRNIEEEVRKLDEDVKQIQEQGVQELAKLEQEIQEIRALGKQRIEVINDIKMKLNKTETDYAQICEQIAQKEELKTKIKVHKSGISRLYYNKKITEIEGRWRQALKETKKLEKQLEGTRQKDSSEIRQIKRSETEVESILNLGKGDIETNTIKAVFQKCTSAFSKTFKALEQIKETKIDTQEFEVKVHNLSSKNYTANIDKLLEAVNELKREVAGSKSK